MNFKRAFVAATAALMMPALASAATIQVFMEITPDTGDAVTVNYQCNAGDNLTDSFSLSDGENVTFTNNLPDGVSADCSVTATAPGGYYDSSDSCDPITLADNSTAASCRFIFVPAGFDFVVEYEVDEAAEATDGGASYSVACLPLRGNPAGVLLTSNFDFDQDGQSDSFSFPPAYEPSDAEDDVRTVCTVTATSVNPSEVEVSSCSATVEFGDDEAGCTISATVFFEGIPTLSQYGMAVMVLLMLGVGFVGFRRFV